MKPIPNCPGYLCTVDGEVLQRRANGQLRTISQYKEKFGYFRVTLLVDGRRKNKLVHRLVAQTFLPNPKAKLQVNHKNGNRLDNAVQNLEWATAQENERHKTDVLKTGNTGSRNARAKLKEPQVVRIKKLIGLGVSGRTIAKLTRISEGSVSLIASGKTWRHV